MIIKIQTDGCRLTAEQPIIADGTVGIVRVRFCTDPLWAGLALSAVFRTKRGDLLVPLTNGECDLPPEATENCGSVPVGLFGTDGTRTLTSVFCRLRIDGGVPTDGVDAKNYTPSLYEQFSAKFSRFENMTVSAEAGDEATVTRQETDAGMHLHFTLPAGDLTEELTEQDALLSEQELLAKEIAEMLASKKAGGSTETAIDLGIDGAAVGQIAQITEVDENGAPTAWMPVDLPSGGGGDGVWELVTSITLEEDAAINTDIKVNTTDNGESFEYRQMMFCFDGIVLEGLATGSYIAIYLCSDSNYTILSSVNLNRVSCGAGGTNFEQTVEFSVFDKLGRVIVCGGQQDTSSVSLRVGAKFDGPIKSVRINSYCSDQKWRAVPFAAGGRVVIYGRK